MAGFIRGQGVPLHRGLHQLVVSTNPNKCFIEINYSRVHRPPSAAELICFRTFCFRTLAMAYIPLQLTKSLSIVSLHLIWTGYSHPGLYLGLKRPRLDYTRVYYGLGQFILQSILWPEGVHV